MIESQVFDQAVDPFKMEVSLKLDNITADIAEIKMGLRQIFDGHILIDGAFRKIKV